tara:strand:- start:184 stop:615 length:432 start_codon:yes stop_codon:yes gene_type:complete
MSTDTASAVVLFFEGLSPERLGELARYYHPQATFKDPFNEVCGVDKIEGIFSHMYETLDKPRFVITNSIVQNNECFLTWEFYFRMRRFKSHVDQVIIGSSHLKFDASGLIVMHRDFWDAAEELYEKLPIVGNLMRWLKKKVNS